MKVSRKRKGSLSISSRMRNQLLLDLGGLLELTPRADEGPKAVREDATHMRGERSATHNLNLRFCRGSFPHFLERLTRRPFRKPSKTLLFHWLARAGRFGLCSQSNSHTVRLGQPARPARPPGRVRRDR